MARKGRAGAERQRSMKKGLGPEGQAEVERARQLAKNGDHRGAAGVLQSMAGDLSSAGSPGMAARALLRSARNLYAAGDQSGALDAAREAAAMAKGAGGGGKVKTHFRDLVRRVRAKQGDEAAQKLQAALQDGLGVQRLGRDRGAHRRGQQRG